MTKQTISAKEAGAILGISAWTLYEWVKAGEIPHIKIGKRVLFRRQTLLEWLDRKEAESVQEGVK